MANGLKSVGGFALGAGAIFLLLLISIWMIQGAVWVGEHVMQFLFDLTWIAFSINVLILFPLVYFRKTRMVGAIGIYISSYVFGLTLWFMGLLITYFTWGFWGVFIGFILGGIGVVPIAVLASLLEGEFFIILVMLGLAILAIGLKVFAVIMIQKTEEEHRHEVNNQIVHEQ